MYIKGVTSVAPSFVCNSANKTLQKVIDKFAWQCYNNDKKTCQRRFVMNKDEILKISQQENKGKLDERELAVFGKASRVGMLVGGLLCVALILVSEFVLNMPELALVGWMVYFAMQGSSNIVLFKYLKTPSKLIYGIIEIAFAVAFAVAIVFKAVA